jgi:hypothetical protein
MKGTAAQAEARTPDPRRREEVRKTRPETLPVEAATRGHPLRPTSTCLAAAFAAIAVRFASLSNRYVTRNALDVSTDGFRLVVPLGLHASTIHSPFSARTFTAADGNTQSPTLSVLLSRLTIATVLPAAIL